MKNPVSSAQLINFSALQQATVQAKPFPHLIIPNFLNMNTLKDLITAFPEISHRGSIPASSTSSSPLFQQLITELEGSDLRQIISEKFIIDLTNKPTMLTLRGHTTERDGYIHTDSTSKLITLLLYMNPTWDSEQGQLRLLNHKDSLEDYAAEVSPLAGNCVIFKVTPNCWHGHYPFIGKRLSLQLNYLTHDTALTKHLNHHRLTAWLKRLSRKLYP